MKEIKLRKGYKIYDMEIIETLAKTVKIAAKSDEEAFDIIREMYEDEDIVLDYSDFADYEINIL